MKRCSACGETKPLAEFYKSNQRPDGLMTWCKPCFRTRQAIYRKRPPRVQTQPGTKRCSGCKTVKSDSEFRANKDFHDGLDRMCKVCRDTRHKAWARENRDKLNEAYKRRYRSDPERFADYYLKRRLGLPSGTYEKLLVAHNRRCGICGATSPGNRIKRFHVDHCHDTGKVRGLLCNNCNRGLGSLQHSERILRAAIKYLLPRASIC